MLRFDSQHVREVREFAERNDKEDTSGDKHPVERVSGILYGIVDVDEYIEDVRGG